MYISDSNRTSFADAVNAAIAQATATSLPQQEEDSDDWLNLDAADFDAMLEKTMGNPSGTSAKKKLEDTMDIDENEFTKESREDMIAKAQAARLQELAGKVEEFVEGEGDIEGARFAE